MSDKNTPPNTQGTRLPAIGKNGAALLSKEYRDAVVNIVNAILNLEVLLPQTDGANVLPPLKATVDISEFSMRIILPPLNTSGGGSSTVPFSGSGAPTSSTLSSSYSYVAGPTPSLYVDLTGLNLWVCTTAGTNSTSAWTAVGGSGSGGSLQRFVIVSDGGDFWLAVSFSGAGVYGAYAVPIQKPEKLRCGTNGIGSEAIRGITYTYSYTAASTVSVTINSVTYTGQVPYYTRGVSGSDGSSETDYAVPDPVAGNYIYALPTTEQLSTFYFTILTAALANAGTGYAATNILTISGGTFTTAAVLTVNSIGAGGAIATFSITTRGNYSTLPTLSGAAVTGGAGSGATFNLTANSLLQDVNADGRAWAK